MSKKQVMGHNPLGYRPLADAKFEFIPKTDSGSGEEGIPSKSASKKTVSYYLEEEVIDEIKRRAKEREDSYSHTVNKILKEAINK